MIPIPGPCGFSLTPPCLVSRCPTPPALCVYVCVWVGVLWGQRACVKTHASSASQAVTRSLCQSHNVAAHCHLSVLPSFLLTFSFTMSYRSTHLILTHSPHLSPIICFLQHACVSSHRLFVCQRYPKEALFFRKLQKKFRGQVLNLAPIRTFRHVHPGVEVWALCK